MSLYVLMPLRVLNLKNGHVMAVPLRAGAERKNKTGTISQSTNRVPLTCLVCFLLGLL